MIKELQHWIGYYLATAICYVSAKLDDNLWPCDTEEDE